jgi:prepilin-type processing-associated H-X9-DG protein
MNSRVHQMISGSNKILALDYDSNVAYAINPARSHLFWNRFKAPRHSEMCNVLLGDGSVDTKSPDDINPCDPEANRLWWIPDRLSTNR